MKNSIFSITLIFMAMAGLLSCASIPKGVPAVSPFIKEQYLGKWYEIARFDFKFEKGLNNTTAEYSMRDDGKIKVLNRGFNYENNEWKQAIGKAKFADNETVAKLKVSFFGPFYSGYNVIAIDKDYKYALVSGGSLDYLWLLSRETTMPDTVKTHYLEIAEGYGFKTEDLLWIEHKQ